MFKKVVLTALTLILVMGMGVSAYAVKTVNSVDQDKVVEGVYIGDVNLSGLTSEQVEAEIQKLTDSMKDSTLTIKTDGHEDVVKLSKLGLKWNNQEILDEILSAGKTGNFINRFKTITDLKNTPQVYEMEYKFTNKKVKNFVKNKLKKYDQDPMEPSITRESGSFVVKDGENGVVLDSKKTVALIKDQLKEGWTSDNVEIESVCKVEKPKHKTEDLKAIKDKLGHKTTTYDGGNVGRTQSLSLSTRRLNGTVIWPGETISVSTLMGERSKAGGYGTAQGYIGTNVEDTVGAGICQTASTFYDAALYAELEIVERHHHTLIVHYVPYAMDSTIYAGSDYKNPQKDLKLKNPYDYPVYVETSIGGGYCSFTIWGKETRPANREVKYVSTTVSEHYPADVVTSDPSHYEGYSQVTQGAFPAVTAYLTKYVYVDGKEVEKTKMYTDTYSGSGRKIIKGTKKKEPETTKADDKKDKDKDKDKKDKTDKNGGDKKPAKTDKKPSSDKKKN